MNVLVIADNDSVANRIPDIKVDLLVSCGDLPDNVIMQVANKCACSHIFAVKGNHDSSGNFLPPIQDLHLKTFRFQNIEFGGFCGSWKYKPRGNYLFEQSEVETALASFPRVDVFVTHNSPRHVHDREDEVHSGFVAFANYLQRCRPKFLLHGHQHLNQETIVDSTRVIGTYGHRVLVIPDGSTLL